jgi:DNA invertase Pin-like site-specific DNA recombinase
LDRLRRDAGDAVDIVHERDERQTLLTVLNPHLTTRGEAGRIVITVRGVIAQMECTYKKSHSAKDGAGKGGRCL